jgi:hypothetical protein
MKALVQLEDRHDDPPAELSRTLALVRRRLGPLVTPIFLRFLSEIIARIRGEQ